MAHLRQGQNQNFSGSPARGIIQATRQLDQSGQAIKLRQRYMSWPDFFVPRNAQGAATLTGVGSLSATGVVTKFGSATLSGTGALSASGVDSRFGSVTLSGIGSLSAVGVDTRFGSATLAGTGSLSAIGTVSGVQVQVQTGAPFGVTVFARVGPKTLHGAARLSGFGRLYATGYASESEEEEVMLLARVLLSLP